MNSSFAHLISHPELLSKDTLYEIRTLLARFPYCQSLRLLLLKNLYLLQDTSFGDELKRSVLYVGDRRVLFNLIEGDKYVPLSPKTHPYLNKTVIETEPGIDRTYALIDAFLSTMPQEEDKTEENFQYVSDYTAYLENEGRQEEEDKEYDKPQMRGQGLIDNFISKAETEPLLLKPIENQPYDEEEYIGKTDSNAAQDDEDESFFTETLAKIYIRQHRYSKALEIIKKLSLKYPKKNAYFADQIRFLEKLIINDKSK